MEQKGTRDIQVTKDSLGRRFLSLISPCKLRQGHGKIEELGYQYDGQFRDDLKHGTGTLTWPDGRQYKGQFEGGKFHGKAAMVLFSNLFPEVWADGRKYEGEYVYGRKHGYGVCEIDIPPINNSSYRCFSGRTGENTRVSGLMDEDTAKGPIPTRRYDEFYFWYNNIF